MSAFLLVAAGALLGFSAGVLAGRWGWLALMIVALVIYVSAGTGNDVPPDWMVTAIPAIPFAFIGVMFGISARRALNAEDTASEDEWEPEHDVESADRPAR